MSGTGAAQKALEQLGNRLRLMAGRAIVNLVNDTGRFQLLQVDRLADETADDLERFSEYGLASNPPAGAEAIVISLGAVRSHGVIIACEHRQYRLKGLATGEVALYDDQGQVVHMKRDGMELRSPLPITVNSETSIAASAPEITVTANSATVSADQVDVDADEVTVTSDAIKLGGAGATKAVMLSDMTPSAKVKAL